jgi:hypothetical protein
VSFEPSPSTPFRPFEATLRGQRWRVTGWITRFAGPWRALGLRDTYRLTSLETATGARGRPASWTRQSHPLQPEDPAIARWERLGGRLPGVRSTPHVTDWEEAGSSFVSDLVVVPDGYVFASVPAEGR